MTGRYCKAKWIGHCLEATVGDASLSEAAFALGDTMSVRVLGIPHFLVTSLVPLSQVGIAVTIRIMLPAYTCGRKHSTVRNLATPTRHPEQRKPS